MRFGRFANSFLSLRLHSRVPRLFSLATEDTENTENSIRVSRRSLCPLWQINLVCSRFKSTMQKGKEKSRILIADDNEPNVELLEAYLGALDIDTAVAVDGQDTLSKVAAFKPHLVLLDIMMPKLSGFEVCKKLKSDPATSHIMILMVTALNELGDIERAVQAGTDDFLSKPVNKAELLKRVDNMLKLYHVTDEVERLRQYIERMESRT